MPVDADGDGWTDLAGDCDDDDASVNPGAQERCDPEDRDEDCDGLGDDADGGATGKSLTFRDGDEDGWGDLADPGTLACDPPPGSTALAGGDCDDLDPAVNPAAPDPTGGDGADDDCDGFVDEDGLLPGAVLFAEMYWRGADEHTGFVPDLPAQWVELVNLAPTPLRLDGWELVLCHVAGAEVPGAPTAADCEPASTTHLRIPPATELPAGARLLACSPEVELPCELVWEWSASAMSFRNGYVALRVEGVTLGPAATTPPSSLRVDDVGYYYIDTLDYWPNAASTAMRLDDGVLAGAPGAGANDSYGAPAPDDEEGPSFTTWCFAEEGAGFEVDGVERLGTPGAPNGHCP